MGDVVKLETHSPLSWTVEDAIERALTKIRSGDFKADKIYIALCCSPCDGAGPTISYTMAGMQVPEVLGWLDLHKTFLMAED